MGNNSISQELKQRVTRQINGSLKNVQSRHPEFKMSKKTFPSISKRLAAELINCVLIDLRKSLTNDDVYAQQKAQIEFLKKQLEKKRERIEYLNELLDY